MKDSQDIDNIFQGLTKAAGLNFGFVSEADRPAIDLMRETERAEGTRMAHRLFVTVIKSWIPEDWAKWEKIAAFAGDGACTIWEHQSIPVPEKEGFMIYARWGIRYLKKAGA